MSAFVNVDRNEPFHLEQDISAKFFQDQNVLVTVLKSVQLWLSIFIEKALSFGVISEVYF